MKTVVRIFLFTAFLSCESSLKKPSAPADEVSRAEMVSLTKNLVLLESHVELSYGQLTKFYKILNTSSESVFKRFKISRERYVRTFDYYASDQDKMTGLYQEILDSLNIENL